MALNVRFEGEVAVLSNVGRTMNDPRYVDAARDVADLLDQGRRRFVIELRGVSEVGAPLLGLLMTMTRSIRRERGEVVLAGVPKALAGYLDEMQMGDFWDTFAGVDAAVAFLRRRDPPPPED